MSIVRSRTAISYMPGPTGDVVAGLLNDGRAERVARVAVDEALRRGARLRFIQVVEAGLSPDEIADADQATFRAAVRALRGFRGIPCRFEVVTGDPTAMLVELAHSASALIVGEGEHDEGLADRIRVLADCPVVTVPPLVA
ncbi:MAG: universal stress protein [Dermatophilaceae bacterium]|nr:universal stress protein [Actinomycetales bacterium]MBP8879874.1 universal stress protein [Dermatophilaceae bacterium]MBP9917169.1 universal stress protein [Dermatophilaceae bacterium]